MRQLLIVFILTLFPGLLFAQHKLQVKSEAGGVPDQLSVHVNGSIVSVDDGGFFTVPGGEMQRIRVDVRAANHYGFIHTIDRRDLEFGPLPAIELVQKRPGRRLLVFAGDAMMTRRYLRPRDDEPALVRQETVAADARRLLDPIRAYIGLADLASVNLETTLSVEPPGEPLPKSVKFHSHPELATALAEAGFDYVALGNNHINDYREGGVQSTLDVLRKTPLAFSGAGMTAAASRVPALIDVLGQPYALLSYVGWPGLFKPSQAAIGEQSGATLGNTDIFREDLAKTGPPYTSVLQYHSGLEYGEAPAMSVQTELRQAIDLGADLALGHHPHVLQGFEIYRNKLIAYSLGNFLFDQYFYTTQLGMLTYVWMDEDRFHRAEVVPLHINGYVPTPATGSMRFATLHRIARVSRPFETCLRGSGAHAVIESSNTCLTQDIHVPARARNPVSVRKLGGSPLTPVVVTGLPAQYRLGTDILRRGEFDAIGAYGTTDRGWIETPGTQLENSLQVRLFPGETRLRAGMRMFNRTYRPSTPTMVSGRVRAKGDARVRILLQRQRRDRRIDDELENGPLTEVGVIEHVSDGWMPFSFSFNQPRVATQGVRILIDIEDTSDTATGAVLEFDDLAWVEWSTPWMNSESSRQAHATHIEYR